MEAARLAPYAVGLAVNVQGPSLKTVNPGGFVGVPGGTLLYAPETKTEIGALPATVLAFHITAENPDALQFAIQGFGNQNTYHYSISANTHSAKAVNDTFNYRSFRNQDDDMNRLEKMAEANADKYGYVGRQYVRLDGRANEGIVSSPVVNTGNNPDNPNAPGYYGNNEPYSGEAPSSGGSYSDYSGAGSSNGSSSGSNTGGGYDHPGSGTTSGDFTPSGGEWEGGNGDQGHGTPEPGMPEDPDFTGYQPIILDLDGDGIQITELSKSTVFVDATGDGLQNQTAWAGAGNGVLFYDPDDTGEITDQRQYVFTEWDPTATSDIEVLWSVFDSNCDGVFDANDDECSNFKMMA